MIVCIVTFKLPIAWTVETAAVVFKATAPKYVGKRGLIRKHYYVSDAGDRAGGIYFWSSREDADACYTQEWIETVTAKYGAAPDLFFAHVPVSVSNEKNAAVAC